MARLLELLHPPLPSSVRARLSYPAHIGLLHAPDCRCTGTRRLDPGRSPHADTAGICTRQFLGERSAQVHGCQERSKNKAMLPSLEAMA